MLDISTKTMMSASGEDKIEHEARTTGRSAYEIAASYTEQYLRDVAEMNVLAAASDAQGHRPTFQRCWL